MKKKNIVALVIALAIVLLLVGSYILYKNLSKDYKQDEILNNKNPISQSETTVSENDNNAETQKEDEQKVFAPDFTVFDQEGNGVHLSDHIGKPIVLNFWASWCGYCKMEMPEFNASYEKLKNKVDFFMINVTDGKRETIEKASDFISKNNYTFPVYYDTQLSAANAYGAYSLPITFFINSEGYVVATATGKIDTATLQKGIDMILD